MLSDALAADLQLAIRGMFYLTLFASALAVFLAVTFGAVAPVYRRAVRMLRRYKREIRMLREALTAAKQDGMSRAIELQALVTERERTIRSQADLIKVAHDRIGRRDNELHRLKEIRTRTENGLVLARHRLDVSEAENAGMRRLVEHVEVGNEVPRAGMQS